VTENDMIKQLIAHGFFALRVGGCVRDQILGAKCKDIDIATSATPDQVCTVFRKFTNNVNLVGKQYAVVIVEGVEITTFRTERYTTPGKPEVTLSLSFEEDSARRDFTINSMGETLEGQLLDFHGGVRDLKLKLIRAVGNPIDRFHEDHSRILRGLEQASRFGFSLEPNTKKAIIACRHLLRDVPEELIAKIVNKVIDNKKLASFLVLLQETGILEIVFPVVELMINTRVTIGRANYDSFMYTVKVVKEAEKRTSPLLAYAALFHQVNTNSEQYLRRLELNKNTIRDIDFIVKFQRLFLSGELRQSELTYVLRAMAQHYSTKQELHVALTRLMVFLNCQADALPRDHSTEYKHYIRGMRHSLFACFQGHILYRADLPVTGKDLLALGLNGKIIGDVLDALILANLSTKTTALAYARRWLSK
jgi:tRNA nucleotidyltransferase/poly(A) polymerase